MIPSLHSVGAAFAAALRSVLRRGLPPVLLGTALTAGATDYLWYGSDTQLGGTNTWDATNTYWLLGGARTLWPNTAATSARAVFGGTTGAPFTVTLASGTTLNANSLWFQNTYTLAAGNAGSTLNFVGTAPTIQVDSGLTVTTNVAMTGTGVTLTGGGIWQLGSSNRLGDSLGLSVDGGSTFSLGAYRDTVGKITLIAGTLAGSGTLTTTDSFDLFSGTVDAALAGAGRALNKYGAGTVTLNGNNTYTGATNVFDGTLALGASNRIATGSALNVSGGNFSLGAFSDTVGAVTLVSGRITGTTGVLTGSSYTLQSGLVSAGLGGTGPLTKSTAGLVTLSGTNTYTGATTINGGTLQLTGALARTTVTVNAGGTLAGTGTATNSRVNVYGTLAPGLTGPGILSTGAEYWYSGGAYSWEINNATGTAGVNWDRLAVSGALTISATAASPFTLRVIGLDGTGLTGAVANFNNTKSYSWSLLGATSISGFATNKFTIDTSAFAASNALAGGVFSVVQSGTSLNLVFTPVPEPATCAVLLGLAALGCVGFGRWRRRSAVAQTTADAGAHPAVRGGCTRSVGGGLALSVAVAAARCSR